MLIDVPALDWDDENIRHIERHDLTPNEVEEAMTDPLRLGIPAYNTLSERRWGFVGATVEGEIIVVIYTHRSGVIRVVTAYSADRQERRRYQRRGK